MSVKKGSLKLTFLIAIIDLPSSNSKILSTNRKGYLCGRRFIISRISPLFFNVKLHYFYFFLFFIKNSLSFLNLAALFSQSLFSISGVPEEYTPAFLILDETFVIPVI